MYTMSKKKKIFAKRVLKIYPIVYMSHINTLYNDPRAQLEPQHELFEANKMRQYRCTVPQFCFTNCVYVTAACWHSFCMQASYI